MQRKGPSPPTTEARERRTAQGASTEPGLDTQPPGSGSLCRARLPWLLFSATLPSSCAERGNMHRPISPRHPHARLRPSPLSHYTTAESHRRRCCPTIPVAAAWIVASRSCHLRRV